MPGERQRSHDWELTLNPYASPEHESAWVTLPDLSDDDLAALLTDQAASRHEVFGDMADVNLYGYKHRRALAGAAAQKMIDAGLDPTVHQAVEWWCLAFVPVYPRETRIVAPYREMLDGDDYGRSIPTAMDWRQACIHATLGIFGLAIVAGVIAAAIWRA